MKRTSGGAPPVAGRGGPASAPGPASPSGAGNAEPPPFLLPASHFVVALAFLLAGGVGLILVAEELSRGAFLLPRVVAVTHLFTLGWITTSILGALYQFLPVALGTSIHSTRVAYLTFGLHVPGLALLVTGLVTGRSGFLVAGAAGLSSGLLLFAGNLALTLRAAVRGGLTRRALTAAAVFLAVTVVLGGALSGNLHWGYLGGDRILALAVHVHVASLGWVLLVIVGVAGRLLPMFLLSHGAPEWPGEAAFWLLTVGVGMLVVGHHGPWLPAVLAAALTSGAGVAAFLLQVFLFYRRSRKPTVDPGMRLAAAGCLFIALSLALAPFALGVGVRSPRLATAYVGSLIVGGFTPFVAGHFYKILPFLTWFHRFGPLAGEREVPRVADLFSASVARGAGVLLVGGAAGLLLGVFPFGAPLVVRGGAGAFTLGVIVMHGQIFRVLTRRPR